jgi:hypothetical protein
MYWWRVSEGVVWRWRKALGVSCTSNEGSRRLVHAASRAGGAAMRARGLTRKERAERRRRALRLNLGRFLPTGYHGPRWTQEQVALLGKEPDDVVAAKTGRSVEAIRIKRTQLGIPTARDRRREG